MSVADTISSMKSNILDAYAVVEDKGGTVPPEKNIENLAAAIATLEDAGVTPGPYGALYYLSTQNGKTVLRGVQLETEADLNAMCTNSSGSTASITVKGITIAKVNIVKYAFGSARLTSLPDYFCYSFYHLLEITDMPNTITTIGNYFLSNCTGFNNTIFVSNNLTSLGIRFLANSTAFNRPVVLSNTKLTTLGGYFMQNCKAFNSTLALPASLQSIGDYVMNGCFSFNSPMTLPESVTAIGDAFMASCYLFNSTLTMPSSVHAIGMSFLFGCRGFNKPLTITGDGEASIGDQFMYQCTNFNSALTITGVGTIGAYFLANCYNYTKELIFDEHLSAIGEKFLYYAYGFNANLDMSKTAVTIIPNIFMNRCSNLVSYTPKLPQGLTTIGDNFMYYCSSLDTAPALPSSLTSIGSYFMNWCGALCSTLTLPNKLQSIGAYFVYRCGAFTGPLSIPSSLTTMTTSEFTLAHPMGNAPQYKYGVKLTGPGATAFKTNYPDSTGTFKRKLIISNTTTAAAVPAKTQANTLSEPAAEANLPGVFEPLSAEPIREIPLEEASYDDEI